MRAASTLLGLSLAVVILAVLIILEPAISPNCHCCSHLYGTLIYAGAWPTWRSTNDPHTEKL